MVIIQKLYFKYICLSFRKYILNIYAYHLENIFYLQDKTMQSITYSNYKANADHLFWVTSNF